MTEFTPHTYEAGDTFTGPQETEVEREIEEDEEILKGNVDGAYGPAQYDLDAWTYDPALSFQGIGASGYIWCTSFIATKPTINQITLGLYLVGTGTATTELVGLYDKHGNRLAVSADQGQSWVTGAPRRLDIAIPRVSVVVGDPYFVAVLSQTDGTAPGMVSSIGGFSYGGAYLMKPGVDGLPMRNGIPAGVGHTSLPDPIDVAAMQGNQQIFAGVKG